MKVLILHPFLASHYKNKLFSLMEQKSKEKGVDITVLQFNRNEASRKGVFAEEIDGLDYKYEVLFDENAELTSNFQLLKKIINRINFYRPQVLNIGGFYSMAHILTIYYCKLRGIKVIISNDSTRLDNVPVSWKELLKKTVVKLADGFFCFGTLAVNYMKSLGATDEKILAKRCAVVDNQTIEKVYYEAFPNRENLKKELNLPKYNFIYVGRIIEIKNLENLILAFQSAQEISKNSSDWGLILLGEGTQKEELQELVDEQVIKNVTWISGQNWDAVPKYLALADVFVLPSKSEPWGLVVNEAMICKMPVIVSDKSGCSVDLVKENGFVFNTESNTDLQSKLLKFMNNEVDLEKMGEDSKRIISQYSIDECAETMLNAFVERVTNT